MLVHGTARSLLRARSRLPLRIGPTSIHLPSRTAPQARSSGQAPIGRYYAQTATPELRSLENETEGLGVDSSTEEVAACSSVALRPYQETAIAACLSALGSGYSRIGVSSPTGSGKTTMFMSLIPRISELKGRTRTLVLVGSVELASQAEAAAKKLLGEGWKIEVEQGKRMASGHADV
jgi:type I site-specific restriction endonuclease